MKKYWNNKERLDLHFKDKFENFEETPDHNVWENIEAGMDIEGFDQIFNNKLATNEHLPSPEVWEKVQEGIPLNLFVKKHLENLMKIAAVLLCFMSATLYFTMDKNQPTEALAFEEPVSPEPVVVETKVAPVMTEILIIEKEDFVAKIKKKKRKKKTTIAKKEQDVDVDALWNLLMEDDEDIANVMDEDTKLKILTPPVRLPLIEERLALDTPPNSDLPILEATDSTLIDETAIAAATKVEPDLKIWVPLVVVEKHEIETLINIYDQAEASKKNNNLSNQ